MILVIDANVLIGKYQHVFEQEFTEFPNKFMLLLDASGIIEAEYETLAREEGARNPLHVDNLPIRIFANHLAQNTDRVARKVVIREDDFLRQIILLSCTASVEQAILQVAVSNNEVILVRPRNYNTFIPRRYLQPPILSDLLKAKPRLRLRSSKEIHEIIYRPGNPSPASLAELDVMLEVIYRQENLYTEFKGTNPKLDRLDQHPLRKAVQGVCGFLNSHRGYVFIGVNKYGQIEPFTPRLANGEIDADQLVQNVQNEIDEIYPCPRGLYKVWALWDDQGKKIIIVVSVDKGDQDYHYRSLKKKKFTEHFTSVYIRDGTRTVDRNR